MSAAAKPTHDRLPGGSEDLRVALGQFATGVAVVTARAPDGRSVGLTVNSFASVSLEPPLVQWSLSKRSSSLEVFCAARSVAIHVLSAEQEALARRFASPSADRFAGVGRRIGPAGTPLLEGGVARFLCSSHARYEAGDHVVFILRVEDWECAGGPALVFHAGGFRSTAQLSPLQGATERVDRQ